MNRQNLKKLIEAASDLWDNYVDPTDAYYDDPSTLWLPLGLPGAPSGADVPFSTEYQLDQIRAESRYLAIQNEFAINALENRISFLVGSGHSYRAQACPGTDPAPDLLQAVQQAITAFCRVNKWHRRQQETVRRLDRDGEAFLRLFAQFDGSTLVRFVEPGQIRTPQALSGTPAASYGIHTDPADVETVYAYYVDGHSVDAREIQHRKANVDANVKRGLPLLYPVRKNLRRAEKLLRNMSVLAETQSAIALVRKHAVGQRDAIQQFVTDGADASITDTTTAKTSYYKRYQPGTILDAYGVDYEFPARDSDPGKYVAVLQAELRAIASRLVMPEFMLTSDASNANYASTLVAESPATRTFDRLQRDLITDDLDVINAAIANLVAAGQLPPETLAVVQIEAMPPTLATRDRYREAQADAMLVKSGAMSVQTMGRRHGLDPDHEQAMMRAVPPPRQAIRARDVDPEMEPKP
jgi:capsid protein